MPYLFPKFELQLGAYRVNYVQSITVTLSRKLPCDTCEIGLPLLKEFDLKEFRENGIGVSSEVRVKLGYDNPEPSVVFTGIITEVSPNQPLKIMCEDNAWTLKQKRFTKAFTKKIIGPLGAEETWYSELAAYAIQQAGLEPLIPASVRHTESEGDVVRESFRVDHQTCAQVLDDLKKNGWDYFCVPGTKRIYFGPAWPWGQGILPQDRKFSFRFGYPGEYDPQNPPNIIKSDGLSFTPREKIGKVIVWLVDSEFMKPAVKGEHGSGEPVREFSFDESVEDNAEAVAAARAKQIYMQLNSNSFEGSFDTIGHPFMTHSVEIYLEDPHHPERSGNYWIDQVEHKFGVDGFLTTISLCEKEEDR